MAMMYPQFTLRAARAWGIWWDGWLLPFGSRPLRRYRVLVGYNRGRDDPVSWVVDPEISKRTWPRHRHLYGGGNLCPMFPKDRTWRYGRDDISHYLDLVVLWLGCQIHLEEYGRWPGPESPDAHLHGPLTFRSEGNNVERAAHDFIARSGISALRRLLLGLGVPPGLCDERGRPPAVMPRVSAIKRAKPSKDAATWSDLRR
jgi:hypothetical protein